MSTLSWIAFDENERRRARRIIALFEEKQTRDELGLGPIRDSISDLLFPGTTTIQTRLRYMLFVPWILKRVEDEAPRIMKGATHIDDGSDKLAVEARSLEVRLQESLRSGGEEQGVIGQIAGGQLLRMPSSIYWNGLGSWGVRRLRGSQPMFFRALGGQGSHDFWHPSVPRAPSGLLQRTTFQLTSEEAGFLVDRISNSHPDSLLCHLTRKRIDDDPPTIWDYSGLDSCPIAARRLAKNAEVFSAVMHGASLLYNLILSKMRNSEEWVQRYLDEIETWRTVEFNVEASQGWILDRFWDITDHPDHRILLPTRRFVTEWHECCTAKRGHIASDCNAQNLVKDREMSLKGARSLFRNRAALDRWGGRSGADRLEFRWQIAKNTFGT